MREPRSHTHRVIHAYGHTHINPCRMSSGGDTAVVIISVPVYPYCDVNYSSVKIKVERKSRQPTLSFLYRFMIFRMSTSKDTSPVVMARQPEDDFGCVVGKKRATYITSKAPGDFFFYNLIQTGLCMDSHKIWDFSRLIMARRPTFLDASVDMLDNAAGAESVRVRRKTLAVSIRHQLSPSRPSECIRCNRSLPQRRDTQTR